uniref:Protein kinase domain-containing protein n=1 Tax=Plectus sambesii TaxID=2011161 RepID=A0A914WBN2_9BILA
MNELGPLANDATLCTGMIKDKPKSKGDEKHEEGEGRLAFLAVIIAVILLLVVVISLLILFYFKSKLRWKTKIGKFRAATYSQNYGSDQRITMTEIKKMNNIDDWTVPRDQLEILYDQKLGSGAFCCVYKGKLSGPAPVCKINPSIQTSRLYSDCDVAIKMLPAYSDDIAKSDFFQEMNFMKALKYHPHLLCLLGTAWDQSEPCLITEYCVNGDLLHYVRQKKEEIKNAQDRPDDLRLKDLLCFSWQVSDGMDFLSSRGCIHRDLAARNVLVDCTNTAKIADFGLCRLMDSPLYSARGGRLPIKWMAIESLRCYEYSSKSDVWSFGVLLFELFSLGDVPFPRVQPADMIDHLIAGNRLEQPEYCTDEIYTLMQSCWRESPDERPNFEIVRSQLAAIIESSSINYGYISVSDGNDRRSLIAPTTDDIVQSR